MITKTDKELIATYTIDSSNFQGNAEVVYIPESIDELIAQINECYGKNIPITFSGAGTGLAGSRVAQGGAVISSEKLNKIIEFDEEKRTITVQPAISNGEISEFLEGKGYFLPPNPTERTASIGGNVSTNASGSRTYLYGPMRNYVQALQVITPTGEILNLSREQGIPIIDNHFEIIAESGTAIRLPILKYDIPNIKHSAGYYSKPDMHPIDYFIGAEGTLGFLSTITLNFIEKPENILGLIVFFDNVYKCINFVEELQSQRVEKNAPNYESNTNPNPRLIEFFDKYSLNMLRQKYTQLNTKCEAAIWIEQEIYQNEDTIIENWYELIGKYTELIDETWAAQSQEEHLRFRDFRHTLPEKVYETIAQNKQYKVGVDGAVPNGNLRALYNHISENADTFNLDRVIYGHIGNNHLHGNVFYKNDLEHSNAEEFYEKTISQILEMNGTVSAEHGIGKLKVKYLYQMFGEEIMLQMRELKQAIDPKLLINQGNLFT